jgi:hypothetical protein
MVTGQRLRLVPSSDLPSSGGIGEKILHIVGVSLPTGKSGVPELLVLGLDGLDVDNSSLI